MRICVFEDRNVSTLSPLTLTRPAFDLWCGASDLLERCRRHFAATEVGLLVRPALAELCRLAHPGAPVNDPEWLRRGATVWVNARWLAPPGPAPETSAPHVGLAGGQVAYAVRPPGGIGDDSPDEAVARWKESLPHGEAAGRMIDHPWDLVEHNADALRADFPDGGGRGLAHRPPGLIVVGPEDRLHIDPDARVEPAVVADTTAGPVVIARAAVVHAFSRLEGPCYVGEGTQVFGGKVRGGTLGPCCRVGGEVEACVLQGYSNKYHEGFLGHSYVGEWVNLGAGTQVSDLRNDYGPVRVPAGGREVDTGLRKVGAFIGDHTKTGLNTLLNTGSVVGAFCNLLPTGTFLPRLIPSFCRCWEGRLLERSNWRQLFATAAAVMGRRGRPFAEAHAALYYRVYEETAAERQLALHPGAGAERNGRNGAFPRAGADGAVPELRVR